MQTIAERIKAATHAVLIVSLLACLSCMSSSMERRQVRAARRAMQSVVKLIRTDGLAVACGVVVSRSGHILTANHVAEDAEYLQVLFPDGCLYDIQVLAADEEADIALLKAVLTSAELRVKVSGLRPARIGKSSKLHYGQSIIVVGNPFALGMSVTAGVVSALHQMPGDEAPSCTVLQVDASANAGTSGGGLFDLDGRLVGIVVGQYTVGAGNMGISFVIPIDRARGMLIEMEGRTNERPQG